MAGKSILVYLLGYPDPFQDTHLEPLALALRPLVVPVVAGVEVVPAEELDGAVVVPAELAEEALLLLLLEAELEEPADEALPFKQEASLPAWIGTCEE